MCKNYFRLIVVFIKKRTERERDRIHESERSYRGISSQQSYPHGPILLLCSAGASHNTKHPLHSQNALQLLKPILRQSPCMYSQSCCSLDNILFRYNMYAGRITRTPLLLLFFSFSSLSHR